MCWTSGYDVNLIMQKKDDGHVIGTVMNIFDAKGGRIKETGAK